VLEWTECEDIGSLRLRLAASDRGLRLIAFAAPPLALGLRNDSHPLLLETRRQLREYFDGSRREFTLPLDPVGSNFQQRVWRALIGIPYGETRSYQELAKALGNPKAVRAVGAANGRNPLPIVIPCHRVIGSDGKLVGYGGGLSVKKHLLDLERYHGHQFCQSFVHSLSIR